MPLSLLHVNSRLYTNQAVFIQCSFLLAPQSAITQLYIVSYGMVEWLIFACIKFESHSIFWRWVHRETFEQPPINVGLWSVSPVLSPSLLERSTHLCIAPHCFYMLAKCIECSILPYESYVTLALIRLTDSHCRSSTFLKP